VIKGWIDEAVAKREAIRANLAEKGLSITVLEPPVDFVPGATVADVSTQSYTA